jgi:hypothetical protein
VALKASASFLQLRKVLEYVHCVVQHYNKMKHRIANFAILFICINFIENAYYMETSSCNNI